MTESLGRGSRVSAPGRAAVLALGVAAALWAPSAAARPEFPGQLAKDPDVPCAPVCTICHLVNPGTAGTAKRPFASFMMGKGLMDVGATAAFASLKMSDDPAIQEMITRLESGYDPNYGKQLACGPQYGCGARVAKAPPRNDTGVVTLMVALSAYAFSRRLKRWNA